MAQKRKLNEDDERSICDNLKSISLFQNTFDEIYGKVQKQSCFKSLKNIGLHEISSVTESPVESNVEKRRKAWLTYSKIKVLTSAVDDAIQNITEEKFRCSVFRNSVKKEILKFLSEKEKSAEPNHTSHMNFVSALDKFLSQNNVKEEDLKDMETSDKLNDDDHEKSEEDDILSECSSDAISSVHTSDLSSFDDEISISSDDDVGRERTRISLKFAEDEIERLKLVAEAEKEESQKQNTNTAKDVIQSKNSLSDSSNATQKSLPRRVRKPNAKYISDDIISPLKIKEKRTKKVLASNPILKNSKGMCTLPRKVGRPRKNPPVS